MPPPPPAPLHTLRTHTSPLTTLFFSADNERLYSGDSDGTINVTSTRTMRPLAKWKAHGEGVLGLEEWITRGWSGRTDEVRRVLTWARRELVGVQGRDNKLHIWSLPEDATQNLHEAATQPGLPEPELMYSLDVNALNYCRFSLLTLETQDQGSEEAYIAVPNLVESSLADVWSLPTRSRPHAAIGKHNAQATHTQVVDGRGLNALGIIMSLHLFLHSDTRHTAPSVSSPASEVSLASTSKIETHLRLLCGYENGSVTLWGFDGVGTGGKGWTETLKGNPGESCNWLGRTSVEGVGWGVLWTVKLHVESVMAMSVTRDNTLALTVSADHLVGRYDLTNGGGEDAKSKCTAYRTKNPGNGSVAIRDDGKVCAVGGWDGKIRLYSTRSLKALGTLDYHKKNTQAVVFAHPLPRSDESRSDPQPSGEEEDEDMTLSEKQARARWLAAGSQDCRISIWPLISFEKT